MHIGETVDGDKNSSALIIDKGHVRKLWFEDGTDHDVTSQTIEIVGLPPAPAALDDTFKTLVPKVHQIMGGRLEPGVTNATNNDATFFIHAGGTLYAGHPYPHEARHIRTGLDGTKIVRDGEVARLVLLILETDQPIKIKAGGYERDLQPDEGVVVGNFDLEDKQHKPALDPHFRKYSRLTNFHNSDITMEEHASVAFKPIGLQTPQWVLDILRSGIGILTAAHPECGNSAWP
jgi:hypothetical protein